MQVYKKTAAPGGYLVRQRDNEKRSTFLEKAFAVIYAIHAFDVNDEFPWPVIAVKA